MDIKRCTDAELLHKILPENNEPTTDLDIAWEEFFRRYSKFLLKVFCNFSRRPSYQGLFSSEDISDMAQQVFTKLLDNDYKALRELKQQPDGTIKPYLIASAANLITDHLRYINAKGRIPIHCQISRDNSYSMLGLTMTETPEKVLLEKELFQQVMAAIEKNSDEEIRERNKEIFTLSVVDGYSRSEIAANEHFQLKKGGVNTFFAKIVPKMQSTLRRTYFKDAVLASLLIFILHIR